MQCSCEMLQKMQDMTSTVKGINLVHVYMLCMNISLLC